MKGKTTHMKGNRPPPKSGVWEPKAGFGNQSKVWEPKTRFGDQKQGLGTQNTGLGNPKTGVWEPTNKD